jgi:hypothetical protein
MRKHTWALRIERGTVVRSPEQNKPGACLQAPLPKLLRENRERAEQSRTRKPRRKKEAAVGGAGLNATH